MPSGMPITSETPTATSTSESVSMLSSHTPSKPEGGDARGREQGQSPAGDHAGDRRTPPAMKPSHVMRSRAIWTPSTKAVMPSSIGFRM